MLTSSYSTKRVKNLLNKTGYHSICNMVCIALLFCIEETVYFALGTKHVSQITNEEVGVLGSIKMAPNLILPLKHHSSQSPPPQLRKDFQLLWIVRQSQLYTSLPFEHVPIRQSSRSSFFFWLRVRDFVVDVACGTWSGAGKPVDGDPGQDFVVGPGVVGSIGPVVEFLVDPGEEAEGGVGEGGGEGEGPGGLEFVVAFTQLGFCKGGR